MKICFMAPKAYQLFNPEVKSTFGGAEVQLYLLSKELAKSKALDVHFMVGDYGQKIVEEIDGVIIWKSIDYNKCMFSQVVSFFSVFNKINADIYIQRTLTPQSGWIALYCKLIRKKFIYMVASDREADKTHVIYKHLFGRILSYINFKLANKIIVQNKYEMDFLSKDYLKNKIYLLKKGLEVQDLTNDNKEKKYYDAAWIGRCEQLKNPEVFLNLAAYFPDKKFLMIVPTATDKEDYYSYILEKAKELHNVEFMNFVEYNMIREILFKCKVFVLTSEKEGDWPMVVLEAVSCGIPIISYKLNYDLLIDKYHCGIFCNDNFDEMTMKFDEILKNDYMYDKMQENAHHYVKENHDIKVNAQKLLEIISE